MRKQFQMIMTLLLIATFFVATTFQILAVAQTNDDHHDEEGYDDHDHDHIFGYTEEDAPPVPEMRFYPYPFISFSIEHKNKNHVTLSMQLEEKADLTLLYGSSNKKDLIKSITKKDKDNYQNITIYLEGNRNFINLQLSNESFDFSTNIEVVDGEIINTLGAHSDYIFFDKTDFGILANNTETEPNDTTSSSGVKTVASDDNNYGSFSSSDTVDYWKFTLQYRAYVNFFLGNIPSGSDYDIYVYKSTNLSTPVWKGTNGGNANEVGLYQDLSPGTYYVKVQAYSNPTSSSNYLMRWKISKHWPVKWSTNQSRGFIPGSHYGIDITSINNTKMTETGCHNNNGCYKGEPIVAMHDGTVSLSSTNVSGYGYAVYINHVIDGKNVQTRYGHLYSIHSGITAGTSVKAGQEIGYMGNRGTVSGTTGLHLHFATVNCPSSGCSNATDNSLMVDPMGYFPGY